MQYENNWEIKTLEYGLDFDAQELLDMLSSNRIAAIRISNFLNQDELNTTLGHINKRDISWYLNSENKQGRIGVSATEYHSKPDGKALYFSRVPECSHKRESIFSTTSDPIRKIIALFSKNYEVSIANEPSMGNIPYFSGLIRAMGAKSTLHFDYAPNQLPGWSVSESEEQFGLVLYLQMPTKGGELMIYDHPWLAEDEIHNKDILEKGPNGFDPAFLKNEKPTKISPLAGDLIIFRTRNFHQIEEIESGQCRLTFNSFMTLKKGALSLWS